MLAKSQRAHWSADCPAQEDSWGLVCGGSRFPAVAGDWEKSGEHSQIKHNSQEMSQNTCERSGFAKYKPRVQYFDLTTQKKMVTESEEKRFWSLPGSFRIKDLSSWCSSPPGCFKKYFQNWQGSVLVVPLLKHQVEALFISFLQIPWDHFCILCQVLTRLLGWEWCCPAVSNEETVQSDLLGIDF